MKSALFILFIFNSITALAEDKTVLATYAGVVSNATGVLAHNNNQSCVLKVSQIDSEKIEFSISVNSEQSDKHIVLTRGGSNKWLTAAVNDYSGPGHKSSEFCLSDWAHRQNVKCQSEVEHIVNINQKTDSQITHIQYKRYKNLSEVGGFDLSSSELECLLTLSAE